MISRINLQSGTSTPGELDSMLPIDDACHKGFYKPESPSRAKRLATFLDINIPYQLYPRPISVAGRAIRDWISSKCRYILWRPAKACLLPIKFLPFPWSWAADPARAAKYPVSAAILTF
jgi:hypothetical protein